MSANKRSTSGSSNLKTPWPTVLSIVGHYYTFTILLYLGLLYLV